MNLLNQSAHLNIVVDRSKFKPSLIYFSVCWFGACLSSESKTECVLAWALGLLLLLIVVLLHHRAALGALGRYKLLLLLVVVVAGGGLALGTFGAHIQLALVALGVSHHTLCRVEEVVKKLRLCWRFRDDVLAPGGDHGGLDRSSSLAYLVAFHIYVACRFAIGEWLCRTVVLGSS